MFLISVFVYMYWLVCGHDWLFKVFSQDTIYYTNKCHCHSKLSQKLKFYVRLVISVNRNLSVRLHIMNLTFKKPYLFCPSNSFWQLIMGGKEINFQLVIFGWKCFHWLWYVLRSTASKLTLLVGGNPLELPEN